MSTGAGPSKSGKPAKGACKLARFITRYAEHGCLGTVMSAKLLREYSFKVSLFSIAVPCRLLSFCCCLCVAKLSVVTVHLYTCTGQEVQREYRKQVFTVVWFSLSNREYRLLGRYLFSFTLTFCLSHFVSLPGHACLVSHCVSSWRKANSSPL